MSETLSLSVSFGKHCHASTDFGFHSAYLNRSFDMNIRIVESVLRTLIFSGNCLFLPAVKDI